MANNVHVFNGQVKTNYKNTIFPMMQTRLSCILQTYWSKVSYANSMLLHVPLAQPLTLFYCTRECSKIQNISQSGCSTYHNLTRTLFFQSLNSVFDEAFGFTLFPSILFLQFLTNFFQLTASKVTFLVSMASSSS